MQGCTRKYSSTRVLELAIDGRPAGRAECAALRALCISGSMVTMVFAHGPTVLTNQVRYDTKRHFLKIFFVVYSIIIADFEPLLTLNKGHNHLSATEY